MSCRWLRTGRENDALQAKFVGRKFYFVLDLHYFCIRENMSGIDAGHLDKKLKTRRYETYNCKQVSAVALVGSEQSG